MRSAGDIKQIAADNAHSVITLSGTAAQISLAEWLFQKLDQPPGARLASPAEYEITGDPSPAVQVYYLANIALSRDIQELVNSMRSMASMTSITTYSPLSAIVARGTVNQMALAQWLVGQIDRADSQPPSQNPAAYTCQPDNIHDVGVAARVFYLNNISQPQDIQEMMNSIRSVTQVQRLAMFTSEKAIILRGSNQQAAAAEWLVKALDKPAGAKPGAALEYQMPTVSDVYPASDVLAAMPNTTPIVEVYYLHNISTPQDIQNLVNAIRTMTRMQSITASNSIRAVVVRGNGGQIAQATQLVQERDKPAQ